MYGILLDDYYMHTIQIIHQGKIYSFGTKNIILSEHEHFSWSKSKVVFKKISKTFEFEMNKDSIKIKIHSGNNENEKLGINIQKTFKELTREFLDVSFNEFDNNNIRYDGILGHIRKQKLSLIKPIQSTKMALIKLEDKLIPVEKNIRLGGNCWLVGFQDIIYPLKNNYFVH